MTQRLPGQVSPVIPRPASPRSASPRAPITPKRVAPAQRSAAPSAFSPAPEQQGSRSAPVQQPGCLLHQQHSSSARPITLSSAQWQVVAPQLVTYLTLKQQLQMQERALLALGIPVHQLLAQPSFWPQQMLQQQQQAPLHQVPLQQQQALPGSQWQQPGSLGLPQEAHQQQGDLQVPRPQPLMPRQAFYSPSSQPKAAQAQELPAQQAQQAAQEQRAYGPASPQQHPQRHAGQPQAQPPQQLYEDLAWLDGLIDVQQLEQLDAMVSAAAGDDLAPPVQEASTCQATAAAPAMPQRDQQDLHQLLVQGGRQPAAGAKRGREEEEAQPPLQQQEGEQQQAALWDMWMMDLLQGDDAGIMPLLEKESPAEYGWGGEQRARKRQRAQPESARAGDNVWWR
jgi:hypothetical protein